MIRQRESKLAGLMLLLTLLFGALFVTPISRAETYEWLYLSLHQNVALPNTNVQLSVYGYLEEPARLSVFYIPVEDLDTASRLAERIPALDAVAPLESRTIALNGARPTMSAARIHFASVHPAIMFLWRSWRTEPLSSARPY